eukprot:TRINITY_DN16523_c0_g1_i1.p1 TRINITY_DN16523_c0_g1~~TRINITY_DN16523_c0_g1_i1.p1  ORF type:complete len:1313 (+),score=238.68 TRINITY_DN16523_c0_g1_i1:58-3996(+)
MLTQKLLSREESKKVQDEILTKSRKMPEGAAVFKLEALSGKAVKGIMAVFYLSMLFAFFTKLYSERVMEIKNMCEGGAGGRLLNTWNSSACQSEYGYGDTISLDTPNGAINITCESGMCLKFDGQVPTLSVLDKMVFTAFIIELGVYAGANKTEFDLKFTGASFIPSEVGRVGGDPRMELFPPSIFEKRTSYVESRVRCKRGEKCDVVMFKEPFYLTDEKRRVQVVVLNFDVIEPYLDTNTTAIDYISVAYIYNYWVETVLELLVRYGGLIFVVWLVIGYVFQLGITSFFTMKPHFRDPGSLRSKPWMTEQKATFIILIFSVLYLNPGKLPTLYHYHRKGLILDGPGWSWSDRVVNFFDTNLPFYYINLIRMYEVILLACCLRQAPKFSFRLTWRSWPYFFTATWYFVFLLEDFIKLGSNLKSYYVGSRNSAVWIVSNSITYMVLVVIWGLVMFLVFIGGCKALLDKPYWTTKSRQLSFRFFFVLYLWHIIYGTSSFAYCAYKYQVGRLVMEDLVCGQILMGHTVGDALSNIIFILDLALFYSPVIFETGSIPPAATDRSWVSLKWCPSWIDYVNYTGNSTMYFFLYESERKQYALAQQPTDPKPHVRSHLSLSRRGLRKALKKMNKHRQELSTKLEHLSLPTMKRGGLTNSFAEAPAHGHHTTSPTLMASFNHSYMMPASPAGSDFGSSSEDESEEDEKEPEVKPLFSLELAVDLMCLSWEVYGEGPGTDHSRELRESVMPIDTWRHGYDLVEVVHAKAEGPKQRNYKKNRMVHRHGMSFRYTDTSVCDICSLDIVKEMAYVCVDGPGCGVVCVNCFEIDVIKNKHLHKHGVTIRPSTSHLCEICLVEFTNEKCFACAEYGKTCFTSCLSCFESSPLRKKSVHQHKMICRYAPLYNCKVCNVEKHHELCYVCGDEGFACFTACRQCTGVELWNHTTDLQALICINDDRIAVSFRGTDNIANVRTDCQMMREIYPAMIEESSWMRELPRVHRGFMKAFRNIRSEVSERLGILLQKNPDHQVCCTGHSLGGALAMLMAYHVKKDLQRDVIVYTFGSPRVGNASFASIYNLAVPDTFRVVNQSDVISRMPFAFKGLLFKHTGREVCIDKKGNLIIEPTFIEKFIGPTKALGLFKIGGSTNILDHGLVRYAKSLSKIACYFSAPELAIKMKPKKKPVWVETRNFVPARQVKLPEEGEEPPVYEEPVSTTSSSSSSAVDGYDSSAMFRYAKTTMERMGKFAFPGRSSSVSQPNPYLSPGFALLSGLNETDDEDGDEDDGDSEGAGHNTHNHNPLATVHAVRSPDPLSQYTISRVKL